MSVLGIVNGHFAYGKQVIFSDLHFSLQKGDLLCILGRNGCGKTTLLSCLNGTLKLGKGDIYIKEVKKELQSIP